MALSANARYTTKPDTIINVPVKSGATIYDGSLCMGGATTGGPATPYDGTIGAILLGWNFGDVNDDGTASPTKTAKLAKGGFIFLGLTVAGLSGSAADIGKKVYATDDGTYTVTSNTTHQVPVGFVCGTVASAPSTLADVHTVADIYGTVGV